jgi:hypothetical protein
MDIDDDDDVSSLSSLSSDSEVKETKRLAAGAKPNLKLKSKTKLTTPVRSATLSSRGTSPASTNRRRSSRIVRKPNKYINESNTPRKLKRKRTAEDSEEEEDDPNNCDAIVDASSSAPNSPASSKINQDADEEEAEEADTAQQEEDEDESEEGDAESPSEAEDESEGEPDEEELKERRKLMKKSTAENKGTNRRGRGGRKPSIGRPKKPAAKRVKTVPDSPSLVPLPQKKTAGQKKKLNQKADNQKGPAPIFNSIYG